MSLIVSLRGANGMVLASDSRGTFGDPRGVTAQNDSLKKVFKLSKYVGALVAGSGEIGATIMNELTKIVKEQQLEGVSAILDITRNTVKSRYDSWFSHFLIQPIQSAQQPVRPDLVIIISGYETDANKKPLVQRNYQLIAALDFAPMLHDYGFALNGIAQYALYLLNRLYIPDSPIEKLVPLAAYVITETASQDGKVGGPVQIMTIDPDKGCISLQPEQVNEILQQNLQRSLNLRKSFFD